MSTPQSSIYVGRFAPSATGKLHAGSLIAALLSFLDARQHRGTWRLRIDDLDHFRCKPEFTQSIIASLLAHGLEWDGDIIYQSQHLDEYEQAFRWLQSKDLIYPCWCTRKFLQAQAKLNGQSQYPGFCRNIQHPKSSPCAWRIRAPDSNWAFDDRFYGHYQENPAQQTGDFIIKRRDGVHSYQLATVVDDERMNITHVVRGLDLLDNTPRQLFLQSALGFKKPQYAHHLVALHTNGDKLSKQTFAKAIENHQAVLNLQQAFLFLGQSLPENQPGYIPQFPNPSTFLDWALTHWKEQNLPQSNASLSL